MLLLGPRNFLCCCWGPESLPSGPDRSKCCAIPDPLEQPAMRTPYAWQKSAAPDSWKFGHSEECDRWQSHNPSLIGEWTCKSLDESAAWTSFHMAHWQMYVNEPRVTWNLFRSLKRTFWKVRIWTLFLFKFWSRQFAHHLSEEKSAFSRHGV